MIGPITAKLAGPAPALESGARPRGLDRPSGSAPVSLPILASVAIHGAIALALIGLPMPASLACELESTWVSFDLPPPAPAAIAPAVPPPAPVAAPEPERVVRHERPTPTPEPAAIVADLDLDAGDDWLGLFPFLATRRPDVYGPLVDDWPSPPAGRKVRTDQRRATGSSDGPVVVDAPTSADDATRDGGPG